MSKAIRNGRVSFMNKSRFIVDTGKRVKFWKDGWCGDSSLLESFLTLFFTASDEDSWTTKVWEQKRRGRLM